MYPNPSSNFDITRRDPAGNASAQYPSAAQTAVLNAQVTAGTLALGTRIAYRGQAMGAGPLNADNSETFVFASSTNFVGFLTRDVAVGGLQLSDRVFGVTSPTPVGIAGPFAMGDQVTVEKGHEIEAEAPFVLLSGNLAVNSGTAIGTRLTFTNGQLSQVNDSEHDVPFFMLTANNLPDSTGGNTRIRAEKI